MGLSLAFIAYFKKMQSLKTKFKKLRCQRMSSSGESGRARVARNKKQLGVVHYYKKFKTLCRLTMCLAHIEWGACARVSGAVVECLPGLLPSAIQVDKTQKRVNARLLSNGKTGS